MNKLTISTANTKTEQKNLLKYRFKKPVKLEGFVRLSSAYLWYNWKNITAKLGNNTLTFNETEIVLPDGSYSVSDINEFIKFKYEDITENKIDYDILTANPVYNRITLKVGPSDTVKFHGRITHTLGISDKMNDTNTYEYKDVNENFKYVPNLENVKSVHIHCNLVYNELQYESKLLYSFTPNVDYGNLIFLEPLEQWRKTRDAVENEIEIYLTDQDGYNLQIEDDMSFTITIANEMFIRK
jgi:hypothetical protein